VGASDNNSVPPLVVIKQVESAWQGAQVAGASVTRLMADSNLMDRGRRGIGRQRERAAWRVGRTHFADLIALIDARYSHVPTAYGIDGPRVAGRLTVP